MVKASDVTNPSGWTALKVWFRWNPETRMERTWIGRDPDRARIVSELMRQYPAIYWMRKSKITQRVTEPPRDRKDRIVLPFFSKNLINVKKGRPEYREERGFFLTPDDFIYVKDLNLWHYGSRLYIIDDETFGGYKADKWDAVRNRYVSSDKTADCFDKAFCKCLRIQPV